MAVPGDLELKKAFTELQAKVMDTHQKVKLADIQSEQLNRMKKHVHLIDAEIMTLVDKTNMHEGAGRMFIIQSEEVIHNQLLEKQKIAEEKLKNWNRKKSYPELSVKETEDNIREMLMARKAQEEASREAIPPDPSHSWQGPEACAGKWPLLYPDGRFIWVVW